MADQITYRFTMGGSDEETPLLHADRPLHASPDEETRGEVDEALRCFWYRTFQRVGHLDIDGEENIDEIPDSLGAPTLAGRPVDADWGIHVNADALYEMAGEIAEKMQQMGVESALELSLWLCFSFGFEHEYFHHVVDSQTALHDVRLLADPRHAGSEDASLHAHYEALREKFSARRDLVEWWLFVEEGLANAAVVHESCPLADLRQAFLDYGLLPQPCDENRGPYALWLPLCEDDDAWDAFCSFVWLQHLTGDHDPLDMVAVLQQIKAVETGRDALDALMESIKSSPLRDAEIRDTLWLQGFSKQPRFIGFGGFDKRLGGLLGRQEIPVQIHGAAADDLRERLEEMWPHRAIEYLLQSPLVDNVEDPYSTDDDDDFIA